MSTKRIAATVLWFMTGWMLGAMVSFALGFPVALAPVCGIAAAVFVGLDPMRILWAPRPAPVAEAAAQLESRTAVPS
jgi:hypothetical protein